MQSRFSCIILAFFLFRICTVNPAFDTISTYSNAETLCIDDLYLNVDITNSEISNNLQNERSAENPNYSMANTTESCMKATFYIFTMLIVALIIYFYLNFIKS